MTPSPSPPPHPLPGTPDVRVDVCGRTDVGRTREHNEDAFLAADVAAGATLPADGVTGYPAGDRALVFMVADGMGGAAAGEIASAMAVNTVLESVSASWRNAHSRTGTALARAIREAAKEANRRIHATATEQAEFRGMGTTATIAGLLGDTLYLAQVGDSRAYLVRGGRALQITKDQSLLQRLVEAGEMTAEEAERSERRNIILQALGPEETVIIDLTHQTVRRGDVLILCSDGLSGLVKGDEIARIVASSAGVQEAAGQLITTANAGGGPDNITVVAVSFDGDGLPPASDSDEVGHRRFTEVEDLPEDDWINGPPPPAFTTDPGAAEAVAAGAMVTGALAPGGGTGGMQREDVRPAGGRPVFPPAGPDRREKGRLWMALLLLLLAATAGVALWRWLG